MLAGLGTVVLAWRLGRRRGRGHGLATAAVMALSYPLVVYSTAARGYSMATFFTFLAIDVLDQSPLADVRLWQCGIFAGAVVLGCLSQPVFVIGYAAMVIWSACDIVRENRRSASLRRFACCHVIPVIFIAIYGFGFVLRLTIGGNPPTSLSALLADALTFTTGLGSGMSSDRITPIVAGLMCIAATVIVGRAWPRLLTFLIPAFILLPAASLGLLRYVQHPDLAPWYFISSMSMMLFAIGLAFGEICRSGSKPLHACGLAIFLAFAGANMLQTYRFSTIGRGHYLAALQYMAANSEGGELELGSDQDSRTLKMLTFYARYLPDRPSIRYIKVANSASAKPRWFVLNVLLPAEIRPTIVLRGTKYTLAQTFPYYAPMGLCWTVYRRVGD
jgi:4-amino-4-deoxy-L-arabinose transferase-like glycosyltransferase